MGTGEGRNGDLHVAFESGAVGADVEVDGFDGRGHGKIILDWGENIVYMTDWGENDIILAC
jgi:hypothetical protein